MSAAQIVLAGGSGFLGRSLQQAFASQGIPVVVLSRAEGLGHQPGVEFVHWDGSTAGPWIRRLEGAGAVINLAGKHINCRLNDGSVRDLVDSRCQAIRILSHAVERCSVKPRAIIQAGATGFYGSPGSVCAEDAVPGEDVLAHISRTCEAAFLDEEFGGARKVLLRLGVVLGTQGGALPLLVRLARGFLGGAAGSGRQGLSWIHIRDVNRVVLECLGNPVLSGTFNAVAPHPVTNAEFMRALRQVLGRPWSPPVPAPVVRLAATLLGFNAELILTGARCVPARLEQAGFAFQFRELEAALRDLAGVAARDEARPASQMT